MFYDMPLSSQGGFLRGAALFSSIFFNVFVCLEIILDFNIIVNPLAFYRSLTVRLLECLLAEELYKNKNHTPCTIQDCTTLHR